MRIKAPGMYMQEMGLLEKIGQYIAPVTNSLFVIFEYQIYNHMGSIIQKSLDEADVNYEIVVIEGDCTREKAQCCAGQCIKAGRKGVLGIGSGSIMDLAKAVGYYAKIPTVVFPTLAASNAACSSVSVFYKEDGSFEEYLKLDRCPDMVLVDTEIIADAPARFLAAGMADGLAVYLENQVLQEAEIAGKIVKNTIPSTVLAMSKECYEIIMENGGKALQDVKEHVCTEEVEKVIEANIYLSGIGFENGGLAAAHSVANGITCLDEISVLHGEAVAIGILTQMVLQAKPQEEIKKTETFLNVLGLPTKLSDIGVGDIREAVEIVAESASLSYPSNQALIFSMRPNMIAGALMVLEL